MPLKFIVQRGTDGAFRFSLVARNGQVLVTSNEYSSRAAVMAGARSIQADAAGAKIEDQSTKAWADGERARLQGRATPEAAASEKAATAKRAPSRRPRGSTQPVGAEPAPEPAEDIAESEVESEQPAFEAPPGFAEPEPAEPGAKLVSLRDQPRAMPEGHTRRVVSMAKPVRRLVSLRGQEPDPAP